MIFGCRPVSEFDVISRCRSCGSDELTPVIDLGKVPLADALVSDLTEAASEQFYPLTVVFCRTASVSRNARPPPLLLAVLAEKRLVLTVTTPRQSEQPPLVGPWFWSSAMFHSATPLAQLRVPPMMRFCVCHLRFCAKSGDQSPPEHSVSQIPLSGCACWNWLCPDTSPS